MSSIVSWYICHGVLTSAGESDELGVAQRSAIAAEVLLNAFQRSCHRVVDEFNQA